MQLRPFKQTDTAAVSRLWQEIFPDDLPHNAPAVVIKQTQAFPNVLLIKEWFKMSMRASSQTVENNA
jgi:hypothetical protein